jgi:5-methyltetrahydropteroyltriglutamate--homocysteine methyltransferase
MSTRDLPPYRADHVGSLLRPPELHSARDDFDAGRITADDLRRVEDAAIADAVRMQERVGLRAATDGEFRRASWHMDFIYQLDGVVKTDERMVSHFRNQDGELTFEPTKHRVAAPVRLNRTIFGDAFQSLHSMVTTATPKLTIPSPSMVHYRIGRAGVDEDVYPDMSLFWSDLALAYADEIHRLADMGCTYLQLDDTCFAYLNDVAQRKMIEDRGEDAELMHLVYIDAMNKALADRPDGMTITTHMCRGNFQSSWVAEGGYDHVAEALFNTLTVDAFFMEFDDERSGGFEPLRHVPPDKLVVLGLITTKTGALEKRDEVLRRIEAASGFVPVDQLCLSPQCGFSSTVEGNALTRDEQEAKLALVVEIADEVWG